MGAEYQVNDRLRIWGSVAHVTGGLQPLWLDGALPVGATMLNGGLDYESESLGTFSMYFHIVHDHYGTVAPYPMGYPYASPLIYDPGRCGTPWIF